MTTIIQDFETSVSGWSPEQSDVHIAQVPDGKLTNAVRSGSNCMVAAVDTVAEPAISNADILSGFDFTDSPYLCIDISVAGIASSDITAKIEYKCSPQGDCDDIQIEQSEPIRVRESRPRTLFWDMSELPTSVLKNPQGVTLSWKMHPDSSESTFSGAVAFDNLRTTTDPRVESTSYFIDARRDVTDKHGQQTGVTPHSGAGVPGTRDDESTTDSESESTDYGTPSDYGPIPVSSGIAEFEGTKLPYTFRERGDGRFETAVCGTGLLMGGGWK